MNIYLWIFHIFFLGFKYVSKTKLCTLNKTQQKDTFIAMFSICKLRNSGLQAQLVPICSQTKGFLWGNKGVIWLFQLTDCLVVFFSIWIRMESGEQEIQRWWVQTWCLGLAGIISWFLRTAANFCKVKFPLWVYADIFCFVLDINYSILVWFYIGFSWNWCSFKINFW